MDAASQIRVLVVDDDESFRMSMEIALRVAERYIVEMCTSGQEAILALSDRKFDVVLLDYKMPEVTGLDVLSWIHEHRVEVPVIMLTAAGSEEVAVEAMKLGAYDYLSKEHIDIDRLPLVINSVRERFLYRMEIIRREREESFERERQKEIAALQTFQNTVNSIGHFVTHGLDRLTDRLSKYKADVEPLVSVDGRRRLDEIFASLREELEVISSGLRSMMDLSALVHQKLESIQRGHEGEMNRREEESKAGGRQ